MKPFAFVVAMDEEKGIGKNGTLAWHLPADLKHFKQVTSALKDPSKQNAVIMGRKTWESLPDKFRPLPGRLNVVLTTQADFALPQGVLRFGGMTDAANHLATLPNIESVFVIGGAQLFTQTITHPACEKLYLTEIKGAFGCDVFFPAIPSHFKIYEQTPWATEGELTYRFVNFSR